jgi:hypothetical protein
MWKSGPVALKFYVYIRPWGGRVYVIFTQGRRGMEQESLPKIYIQHVPKLCPLATQWPRLKRPININSAQKFNPRQKLLKTCSRLPIAKTSQRFLICPWAMDSRERPRITAIRPARQQSFFQPLLHNPLVIPGLGQSYDIGTGRRPSLQDRPRIRKTNHFAAHNEVHSKLQKCCGGAPPQPNSRIVLAQGKPLISPFILIS